MSLGSIAWRLRRSTPTDQARPEACRSRTAAAGAVDASLVGKPPRRRGSESVEAQMDGDMQKTPAMLRPCPRTTSTNGLPRATRLDGRSCSSRRWLIPSWRSSPIWRERAPRLNSGRDWSHRDPAQPAGHSCARDRPVAGHGRGTPDQAGHRRHRELRMHARSRADSVRAARPRRRLPPPGWCERPAGGS